MADLSPIILGVMVKSGIILGASGFLVGFSHLLIWRDRQSRSGFHGEPAFKIFQWALAGMTGFLLVRQPLWAGLSARPSLATVLMDDLCNLGLLLIHCFFSLFQSYRLARRLRFFHRSYAAYLIQTGFLWVIFINLAIFLRLESEYLPRLNRFFSGAFASFWLEMGVAGLFLAGLGLALKVRDLGMADAPPFLNALVQETAAVFGIKVSRIKLWRLDGIRNAFATGFWKRSIFLTEALVQAVDVRALKLIIGHECAHFKHYHLEARVLMAGFFLILGSFLTDIFPDGYWQWWLSYGLVMGLFFLKFLRHQEFQADLSAAIHLDGGAAMADALLRTFGPQPIPRGWQRLFGGFNTHPPLAARIRRLQRMGVKDNPMR